MTEAKIEFDRERASQYDLDIRKSIPGYESLHGMTQSLLQTSLSKSARLLIVGSGTGMELVNYSKPNPEWFLTGVDPASEMMAIAQAELTAQGLQKRVNLHTGYVNSLPETEPMDAATLMLVMHFLTDDGAKLQLLQDITQRLKPGAKFILADIYGDRSASYFSQFTKAWQVLYFSQLDDETRTKAEAKFQTSISNSIHFVTEARIIELLEAAGFSQIAKFYNAFLFGGWIAQYTGS
ncbi:class I SAM-dependent methyltransferase [Pleurocapsa sp. CCALA 161]|uniref:class I SAM-dependent methyltransferase n=1 Tax=Pleurocapsa sp. CCALA 161 TaxID=2107688 RepID=UPI000D0621FE|nr:class I SAM-dependent methyltransferase [Pleurocapsa sp. CCALA 161]PSB11348.1 class I SAM-dependent methyltransferase [Pleurocapsa sp. CCALA 161]